MTKHRKHRIGIGWHGRLAAIAAPMMRLWVAAGAAGALAIAMLTAGLYRATRWARVGEGGRAQPRCPNG